MRFIVVGVDGSNASRLAMDEAIQQAEWREAVVVAAHVVHLPTVGVYDAAAFVDATEEFERAGKRLLDAELAQLVERHPNTCVDVEGELLTGHAGFEIVRLATDTDRGLADLVVLGSRGYGGFRGLLLGSVTTYVIHHLRCPVTVIPSVSDDS